MCAFQAQPIHRWVRRAELEMEQVQPVGYQVLMRVLDCNSNVGWGLGGGTCAVMWELPSLAWL